MRIHDTTPAVIAFLGDIAVMYAALAAMLFIGYGKDLSFLVARAHFVPFSFLMVAWLAVFIAAGLYDRGVFFSRKRLTSNVLGAQTVNLAIAVVFFYFVPFFTIAPKTNLFLYVVVATALLFVWRLYGAPLVQPRAFARAVLAGSGPDITALADTLRERNPYGVRIVASVNPQEVPSSRLSSLISTAVRDNDATMVTISLSEAQQQNITPLLYTLLLGGVRIVDTARLYESIFDRTPLSLIRHEWFLEQTPHRTRILYDGAKRLFDVVVASLLLVLSSPLYPIVALAIKIEDGGGLFFTHKRVGKNNKIITLHKFQSWKKNQDGVWASERAEEPLRKIAPLIRKTRIDELPQLWSVLKGDLSLIGPRPDTVGIAERVRGEIPFYDARYFIKPGLSGWAQIKQEEQPQSIEEMKLRLSYDLFYIKNRSFVLDLVIALRTAKTLLIRAGR